MLNYLLRRLGGVPAFRVYGKTRRETEWRIVEIYATPRRNRTSRWPLLHGVCTCWSAEIVAVGCDFAERLLSDPRIAQVSRENPVRVVGGGFRNLNARLREGTPTFPTEAEVLAHEIGHTGQALRYGVWYLPIVGSVTLFGEGPHWWNHFENDASEQGEFGGLVS